MPVSAICQHLLAYVISSWQQRVDSRAASSSGAISSSDLSWNESRGHCGICSTLSRQATRHVYQGLTMHASARFVHTTSADRLVCQSFVTGLL
jgi:hypothetical protein